MRNSRVLISLLLPRSRAPHAHTARSVASLCLADKGGCAIGLMVFLGAALRSLVRPNARTAPLREGPASTASRCPSLQRNAFSRRCIATMTYNYSAQEGKVKALIRQVPGRCCCTGTPSRASSRDQTISTVHSPLPVSLRTAELSAGNIITVGVSNASVAQKCCSSHSSSQRNPRHSCPEQHGMRREHPQEFVRQYCAAVLFRESVVFSLRHFFPEQHECGAEMLFQPFFQPAESTSLLS